jgi:hypothetical protein
MARVNMDRLDKIAVSIHIYVTVQLLETGRMAAGKREIETELVPAA